MKVIAVVILAYLVAAVCYVWRALAERNVVRQKPYTWKYRQTGDLRILIVMGLGWIVGLVRNVSMRGRLTTYEMPTLVAFIGSALLFWLIISN